MNILNRIDNIRKQPEHIRLRWAWGLTAVSMLFVFLIWAISIKMLSRSTENEPPSEEQQAFMKEFQQQKKSIQDATGQLRGAYDNSAKTPAPNAEQNLQEGFARE